MNQNDDAPREPERDDVMINVPPDEAVACAFTPEIKVEFDRIVQVLEEMKGIQEDMKRAIVLNRITIIVTALFAFVTIVLQVNGI